MSKIVKKTLKKVSIGSYIHNQNDRVATLVERGEYFTRPGDLFDTTMGILNIPGTPKIKGDFAYKFGHMGIIILNSPMLNPVFEEIMLKYLSLFKLNMDDQVYSLEMREGVISLVRKHSTLSGYRRLKAIAEDIVSTNPWKIDKENADIIYKLSSKDEITVTPNELKEMLINATERYSGDSDENFVTLKDIGINTDIVKPEDFIRDDIPVIPNILRAPQMGSSITPAGEIKGGAMHPFSTLYNDIIAAKNTNDNGEIRKKWMALIKDSDKDSLKNAIFRSDKKAFIRGSMFAKVGGQIARSVLAPNPRQKVTQVGIPRRLAKDISFRMEVTEKTIPEISRLIEEGHITHLLHMPTREYIPIDDLSSVELKASKEFTVLRELKDGDVVLLNRQPTLHRGSILGFTVFLHDDDVIKVHPACAPSFGMDYDG